MVKNTFSKNLKTKLKTYKGGGDNGNASPAVQAPHTTGQPVIDLVPVTGTNPTGTNPTGTNPTGTNPTGTNPTGTNPTGQNNIERLIQMLTNRKGQNEDIITFDIDNVITFLGSLMKV